MNPALATTPNVISSDDVVYACRMLRTSQKATTIARFLGTTTRAVATAARVPIADGRLKTSYKGGLARYRFVRMKAKVPMTTRNFRIRAKQS